MKYFSQPKELSGEKWAYLRDATDREYSWYFEPAQSLQIYKPQFSNYEHAQGQQH